MLGCDWLRGDEKAHGSGGGLWIGLRFPLPEEKGKVLPSSFLIVFIFLNNPIVLFRIVISALPSANFTHLTQPVLPRPRTNWGRGRSSSDSCHLLSAVKPLIASHFALSGMVKLTVVSDGGSRPGRDRNPGHPAA